MSSILKSSRDLRWLTLQLLTILNSQLGGNESNTRPIKDGYFFYKNWRDIGWKI